MTDANISAVTRRAITGVRADRSRPQHLRQTPHALDHVLARVGADGWVEIGVIVGPGWSHDWRVWLNVESGEGLLPEWTRQ